MSTAIFIGYFAIGYFAVSIIGGIVWVVVVNSIKRKGK